MTRIEGRPDRGGASRRRLRSVSAATWALDIGLIWAAFDRRKQGWHDKIAGTLVIRRDD